MTAAREMPCASSRHGRAQVAEARHGDHPHAALGQAASEGHTVVVSAAAAVHGQEWHASARFLVFDRAAGCVDQLGALRDAGAPRLHIVLETPCNPRRGKHQQDQTSAYPAQWTVHIGLPCARLHRPPDGHTARREYKCADHGPRCRRALQQRAVRKAKNRLQVNDSQSVKQPQPTHQDSDETDNESGSLHFEKFTSRWRDVISAAPQEPA